MKLKKLQKLKSIPFLLSAAALGCAMLISIPTRAESKTEGINIDDTFTDSSFKTYVKTNFDTDKNDSLSQEEIAKAETIDFEWDDQVKNLTGLSVFTNLKRLSCAGTGITSIDLSKNPELTELDCTYTELDALNVRNNTKLQKLECYETYIGSLDVSKNVNLIRLDCNNTPLQNLDVRNNSKLFALNCEDTNISTLNISKNPELYEVYITNTPIADMDFTKNKELVHIRVSGTNMTKLNVTKNTKLAALYCYNTKISELDLRNNPDMFEIFCNNSRIRKLDVTKFAGLRTLYCHDTRLTQLNVSNNPNLVGLNINNTMISKLDVSKNIELQRLEIANTKIVNPDLSKNKNLRYLDCTNTTMNNLDLSRYSNLQEVYCVNAKVKTLKLPANKEFCGLDCSGNQIAELKLSHMPEMWLLAKVSPQSRSASFKVCGDKLKLDMKNVVSDISKVSLESSTSGSYDRKTGILTVNSTDAKVVTYLYEHGYKYSGLEPMKVTLKITKEYNMLEGAGQIYEEGKDLVFRSEADFDDFRRVLIDGKELSQDNYTVTEGSTIVTLKDSYLKTLSGRKHEISIVSADGVTRADFTVPDKKIASGNDDNKNSGSKPDVTKLSSEKVKTGSTPDTADHSQTGIWLSLFIAALLCMVLNVKARKAR